MWSFTKAQSEPGEGSYQKQDGYYRWRYFLALVCFLLYFRDLGLPCTSFAFRGPQWGRLLLGGILFIPPLVFCLFVLTQTKFSLFPQPISLSAGHLISSPKPNVFLHSLLSKLSSSIFIFCWSFVFPFAFTVCLYFFPPSHLSPTV